MPRSGVTTLQVGYPGSKIVFEILKRRDCLCTLNRLVQKGKRLRQYGAKACICPRVRLSGAEEWMTFESQEHQWRL